MIEDPSVRHARVLEDLDRQIDFARLMFEQASSKPGKGTRHSAAKGLRDHYEQALRGLRGRRNILQRHAPIPRRPYGSSDTRWVCQEHGYDWEDCPDWRDAAGVENPDG